MEHIYNYGAVEIVVRRPCLDDQERQRRESSIRRALANYGKEMFLRGCLDAQGEGPDGSRQDRGQTTKGASTNEQKSL